MAKAPLNKNAKKFLAGGRLEQALEKRKSHKKHRGWQQGKDEKLLASAKRVEQEEAEAAERAKEGMTVDYFLGGGFEDIAGDPLDESGDEDGDISMESEGTTKTIACTPKTLHRRRLASRWETSVRLNYSTTY